jgi:glutaconate CoA-transferase subunit A
MTTPRALSLAEAVGEHAPDGATVYLGNFGAQLFAVGHELIRRGAHDLDVVMASGGILLDQLIGAGVVRSAVFGHCWSPVGPSPAHNFRRVAQEGHGSPVFHELSLGHITAALTGGAWDVPFMAVPGLPGTGFADEDWSHGYLQDVTTALGRSTIVRSIAPDVAFVHVDAVDADGNGLIIGPVGEAVTAAHAARHVVLVAEELVHDDSVVVAGPTIPGLVVDAVVHHPGAAAPDGVIGRYDRDVAAYEDYARSARTEAGFAAWLHGTRSSGSVAHA